MTLPISTATLYLQPDGTYSAASTGAINEVPVTVNVTDAVCTDDLDPSGNETTSDAQGLAQDIYHILLETLGSNLDDPNRGIGTMGYLSGSTTALAGLPSIIDSQLRKDTRIQSSQTTLRTLPTTPVSYQIQIQVNAIGSVIPLAYVYSNGQLSPANGAP